MQLMSIGTQQLHQDGTLVLDSYGSPVPTYDQNNIAEMARALSGWSFPASGFFDLNTASMPMRPVSEWHDNGSKVILPGITLPTGQGAQGDLDLVLDTLFSHNNIGPFLSRRLIQHLVSSNPSPQYISRVSQVFSDDGHGTRGNLGAVIKAVLLDPEARHADNNLSDSTTSHYLEPILFLSDVMNIFGGTFTDDQVQDTDIVLGQPLYREPSVFSYFSPDHQISPGLYAPEAQLLDTSHFTSKMAVTYSLLRGQVPGLYLDLNTSPFTGCQNQSELLDRINHLLLHGTMPSEMKDALTTLMNSDASRSMNSWLPDILFVVLSSSSFQVIH